MTDELLLAIDAGTGSCRAALFDAFGRQISIGQREYVHHAEPGVPGSQRFDTAHNWSLICACIREAIDDAQTSADAIRAVSTSSMREGMVLYNRARQVIWACPNVDSRAIDEAAALVTSGRADEIYTLAGDWVSITAPARLLWLAKHRPETFAEVAHLGMIGDWILTQLCGEWCTDPSLGSSSGMFELAERSWSPRVLELVGLPPEVVPPVHEPGTVAGMVTAAAAEATGLRIGTPCVIGGADTQLGLVGIGTVSPGRLTVIGGSFWQQTALLDEPLVDPRRRLRTLCHVANDRWMIEGIGFYSGLAMRWFRDAFYETHRQRARGEHTDLYDLLDTEAAMVPPGSNGLVGIFSNVMRADRWVHAAPAFIGFDITDPSRSGRKECVRAIMEAAAYVTLAHLQIVEELGEGPVSEVLFTGGAAKASLWPQLLADVLGLPVSVSDQTESTALGAALCAAVGAGFQASLADAAKLARVARVVQPDDEAGRQYSRLFAQWRETYDQALELTEASAVRPLWRAAGT